MTISSIYDLKSISRTPVADLGSGTPLKKFLIRDYISIQSFKRIRENFFLKKNWFSGYLLLSTIATRSFVFFSVQVYIRWVIIKIAKILFQAMSHLEWVIKGSQSHFHQSQRSSKANLFFLRKLKISRAEFRFQEIVKR